MRLTSNLLSGTNTTGNTSDTATTSAAGSTATAPTGAAVAAPVSGTSPGVSSRRAGSMRNAGLGRIFGTVRPTALEEPVSRYPAASATAALVAFNLPSVAGRPALHREAGARDLQHTHQELPVVAQVQLIPVARPLQQLSVATALHGLPVATMVEDLPVQYARPVLRRQIGSINMLHELGEVGPAPQQNTANRAAVPDLAERPPLHREVDVMRPSNFLNPADRESGSRMRPR